MLGRNSRRAGISVDRPCDILIAIAGRQHADQLTAAMVEDGWNAELRHTTAIRPQLAQVLAKHHQQHPLIGLIFRVGNRLLPNQVAEHIAFRMFARFDRKVSRALPHIAPKAVVVYETCALETLKAAKRLGLPTILDAASVHHSLQATPGAETPFRAGINARKDAEIALADHILCCSAFAAQSYIDAGVPKDRVHAIPLGFEAASFGPSPDATLHRGPLRIAFAGRFTRVKGADLLADALATLAARGLPFECRIAAARADGDAQMIARLGRHATLLGKVPHGELAELYRWADILVMPSRFDSFGLVLLEALACGLPVLASDHVGASDFIVSGVNGDVVSSEDIEVMTGRLVEYATDPAPVRSMRAAAIASAQGADWSLYRIRVAQAVTAILGWTERP